MVELAEGLVLLSEIMVSSELTRAIIGSSDLTPKKWTV